MRVHSCLIIVYYAPGMYINILLRFWLIILKYLLNTYPVKLEGVENQVKILFFHHIKWKIINQDIEVDIKNVIDEFAVANHRLNFRQ